MKSKRKFLAIVLAFMMVFSLIPSLSFADMPETFPLPLQVKTTSDGDPLPIQKDVNGKWIVSVPTGTGNIFISNVTGCALIDNEAGEIEYLIFNDDVAKDNGLEVAKPNTRGEYEANLSDFGITDENYIAALYITDNNLNQIALYISQASELPIAKEKLNEAILKAPQTGYHKTDDRYNGNQASSEGFWKEYQDVLTQATAVNEHPAATQQNVDDALQALTDAISKLIPSTQANTTKLYEALQGIRNLPTENTGYTAVSWDNYVTAKETAQTLFAGLFKEKEGKRVATENNKAEKQGNIDNAAKVLTAAKEDLLQSKGLEERIALWKEASTWLLAQNQQVQQGQYTEASASAWNTAFASLQKAMQDGYQTQSRYDAYTSSVVALSTAYYDLQDSNTKDITVHVRVADNFGAMFPEYAIQDAATATFDQHVTLGQGNKTINALLHAMSYDDTPKTKTPSSGTQYGEGWKNPEVMVYINGTLAVNRSKYIDSWQGYIGKRKMAS